LTLEHLFSTISTSDKKDTPQSVLELKGVSPNPVVAGRGTLLNYNLFRFKNIGLSNISRIDQYFDYSFGPESKFTHFDILSLTD